MGPSHRTESTNDIRYLDEKATSNHSMSSIMCETSHSNSTGIPNGVILQITSHCSKQEEEGKNNGFVPVLPSINGTMGNQNVGFVRDQNDLLKEIQGVVDTGNDIDTESGQSTPVTPRGRAQSKVSFSDDTKTSIYKRMDSIPAEETGICQKVTSLRWQTALMCCVVASLSITIRQCMSMAIVCMSGQTTDLLTNSSQDNVSLFNTSVEKSRNYMIQWDMETQGLVLSSYYYTFPLTPLIGGFLAGKFGGKYVIFMQIFLMSGASISIPFVAYINPTYVMVARAVVGFASGGLMPATVQLLSKWAPRLERSRMLSLVNSGQSIGNILTFLLSGFICMIPLQGGWPFIFYIFTSLNFLALLLWACVVYDSPEVHPRATVKEVIHIIQERRSSTSKMPSPPWIKLITSGPFWAILTAHTTHGFIFTVIGTFLPLYMKDVLMYDPTTNGVLSSLPFIGRFTAALAVGFTADKCMEKKWFSTGTTRKILQCIGMIGSAPFLIALSYMTAERRTLGVILLVCYWTMQSTTEAAFRVNHLDIAPTYAGVINGITLTCASLASLVAPVVTAAITINGTREEWQIVFSICVGLGVFGAIVFCILGSGEEQEWAKDPNLEKVIRRLSTDLQLSAENSNGLPAGFTLGGKRRKSSQKPLVDISLKSINGQENNNNDCADSSLEETNLSFITETTVNGISSENNLEQPEISSCKDYENKLCFVVNDLKFSTISPASPTFSYASYGFESKDEIAETVFVPDESRHTVIGTVMDGAVAAEANIKILRVKEDASEPHSSEVNTRDSHRERTNIIKNKNHKNLCVVLSKDDTISEVTHL